MIMWETVFPFWNSLSELQRSEILDSSVIRQYGEGEIIKKRQGLYIVNEGGILVYVIHVSGRKRVLLTGNRFEVILLTKEFLSASNETSLEVRAAKDSEIYFIPEESLILLENEIPAMRRYVVDALSKHMNALTTNLYEGLENIGKQLAMFLLRIVSKHGGKPTIEISHEEIAERLGTTREVITRNIRVLKDLGLVETGRNRINIKDVEGINDFIKQQDD